jgi:hypothetical protein
MNSFEEEEQVEIYRRRGELFARALEAQDVIGFPPADPNPTWPIFPKSVRPSSEDVSAASERSDAVGGDDAETTRLKVLERLL